MPADRPSDLRARTGALLGATRRHAARLTGVPGRRGRSGMPVAPTPERLALDSWLSTFWGSDLDELDRRCAASETVPWEAFRALPDDVWAALLTQEYGLYPNI